MADAPKSKGKGISKKLGPLPYWGWGAVGVGTFLGYRYLKARSAAAATTAATGTTGGDLLPNDVGTALTGTATATPTYSTVASWTQAALSYMTGNGLDGGDALNAITSWLNGNCVSQQGYNAISSVLSDNTIGLPPGYSTLPTLSVCASSSSSGSSGGGSSGTTTTGTPTTAGPISIDGIPLADFVLGEQGGVGYINVANPTQPITDVLGRTFSWLPDAASVQAAQSAGTPLYYMASPGTFEQIGPGFNSWQNTPIYVIQGSPPASSGTTSTTSTAT